MDSFVIAEQDQAVQSDEPRTYRIGDLARRYDVTLRTLRFYEDKGLLQPERRGTSRIYSEGDRERLELALFGKRIGLALSQIRRVLEADEQDASGREVLRSMLADQREELVARRSAMDAALVELDERLSQLPA